MTLATDNFGSAKNYQIDLPQAGLDKEMDAMHHFIKHFSCEKARVLKVEIFEHPTHAVLTLAQHSTSLSTPKSERLRATHIVKLWISKHADRHDSFHVECDIHTLKPQHKTGFLAWVSHTTQKVFLLRK